MIDENREKTRGCYSASFLLFDHAMKRKPGQTFSPMVSSGRLQYNVQIAVGFRNVILRAAARIACGSFQQVYIAALEFIRVF